MDSLSIATAGSFFAIGFLSGFLVRKNWYLFRAVFGAKSPRQTKKEKTTDKKSDTESIQTESSDLDPRVSFFLYTLNSSILIKYKHLRT